jgi:hypothetical protein
MDPEGTEGTTLMRENQATEVVASVRSFARELEQKLEADPHLRAFGELQAADGTESVLSGKAAEVWEQNLEEKPDDPLALHHLAVIYHGRAIEAERQGGAGLETLRELWEKALWYWAKLCAQKDFWDQVKQLWARRREEDDADADRFREDEWDAFRLQVPEMLLSQVEQRIKVSIDSEATRARMYMNLLKNAEFPARVCERKRRSIYRSYAPSDSVVDKASKDALKRVESYLAIDDSLVDALRDSISLTARWIDYLRQDDGGTGQRKRDVEKAYEKGREYAQNSELKDRAESDALVADVIARMHIAASEYYDSLSNAIYTRTNEPGEQEVREMLPHTDRAWKAARAALPFDRISGSARLLFTRCARECCTFHQILGNLDDADRVADAVLEVDPGEPRILYAKAKVAADQAKTTGVKKYLARARKEATERGEHSLLAEIEAFEQSPLAMKGLKPTYNRAQAAYKRNDWGTAIRGFQKCVDAGVDDPETLLQLGQCYALNGNIGEGRELLMRAMQRATEEHNSELLEIITQQLGMLL